MKYSQLKNKKVISIYENQIIGHVENIVFSTDYKRILGVTCKDDFEKLSTFFIPLRKIFSFGENAILIRNLNSIEFENNKGLYLQENVLIFSIEGLSHGFLIDSCFDEKGHNINFVTSENFTFDTSNIVSINKELAIISKNKTYKNGNFKPKKPIFIQPHTPNYEVKVLSETNSDEVQDDNKSTFNPKNAVFVKAAFEPQSILGKKAGASIVGINNELIVRNGQIITEKHLINAKQHGKLRDLIIVATD